MKKTLSIIAALVSSFIVSGCFNSDDSKKKDDSSYGKMEVKQYIPVPALGNDVPMGVSISEAGDMYVVSPGDAPFRSKAGKIWTAPPGSSTLTDKEIVATAAQGYYGFNAVAYSKTLDSLFACSNPPVSMGTVAPTLVQFKLNAEGKYVWTSALNFPAAMPGQICYDMTITGNRLLVVNAAAIDLTYPAVYQVDLTKALPTELPVLLRYSDFKLDRSQLLEVTLVEIASAKNVQNAQTSIFLLDRSRRSIDKFTFDADEGNELGLLRKAGEVEIMGFDAALLPEPTSLVNLNDHDFIVTTGINANLPAQAYLLRYDGTLVLPSTQFLMSFESPVYHMIDGMARSENADLVESGNVMSSIYATMPTSKDAGHRLVELTYTPGK